uniref:Uncharacterized protein n=1 Tax=Romanomermis culicivorax TaxID=13658 RepID=A0A915J7F4_ROMCU
MRCLILGSIFIHFSPIFIQFSPVFCQISPIFSLFLCQFSTFFEAVFTSAFSNDCPITYNQRHDDTNISNTNIVDGTPYLPMQVRPSAAHSVTLGRDATHHNNPQRGATTSEMGAHLRNDFPQGMPMSALSTHHQIVLQEGALTSTSGAHLQTTLYQGPWTSTIDAGHQNDFLQGALTSARGTDNQYAFP